MKRLSMLLCLLTVLILLAAPAQAATPERTAVRFFDETNRRYEEETEIDVVNVLFDGAPLETDLPAINHDGRTLVPVRFVAQALGAEVEWRGKSRQVVLTRGRDTLILTLGRATASVNGKDLPLPDGIPAQLVEWEGIERTLVPLRFVSQRLDALVDWDDGTYTAAVSPSDWTAPEDWDPSAFTVALDAGHGGSAPGAVYEGCREKDITLPITLRAAQLLREKGYNVVLTRSDDSYVDLYDRCATANRAGADLFVSIHCNANTARYIQGTFTYYYPGYEPGRQAAQCLQSAVAGAAGSVDRGLLTNDYVVIREPRMPSCLVETGFLSNHDELTRLITPAYQEKLARGIANGAEDYFKTLPPKAG